MQPSKQMRKIELFFRPFSFQMQMDGNVTGGQRGATLKFYPLSSISSSYSHLISDVLHKVFVGCHYVKWLFLHLLLAELIELLEAMAVDDFLQWPVVVASGVACVVEEHDFSILSRIGMPLGKTFDVRVACVGELCP